MSAKYKKAGWIIRRGTKNMLILANKTINQYRAANSNVFANRESA